MPYNRGHLQLKFLVLLRPHKKEDRYHFVLSPIDGPMARRAEADAIVTVQPQLRPCLASVDVMCLGCDTLADGAHFIPLENPLCPPHDSLLQMISLATLVGTFQTSLLFFLTVMQIRSS